jgi:hypothetical protein
VLKVIEVRHQVAIAGRVIDAGTQKPLAGAEIEIAEMPPALKSALATKSMQYGSRWDAMAERPDRARTAADGLFYFLDLPDGQYTVAASVARLGRRYGVAQCEAKVSRDAQGKVKLAFKEISLQATAVHGKVTGPGHEAGVVMAEIRVKGSGERAFSDESGKYVLAGIEPGRRINDEPGKRTIIVTAQGYRVATKRVTIEHPGQLATLDFPLARETAG